MVFIARYILSQIGMIAPVVPIDTYNLIFFNHLNIIYELHWSSILLDIRDRHWNMLRHDVISIFRHFGSQFIHKTNAANPNSLHTAVGNGGCGSANQSTVHTVSFY